MWEGEWLLEYPGCARGLGGTNPADPFKRPRNIRHLAAPDIGDVAVTTDDQQRPRTDGVEFGIDFRGGRTIRFELGLQGDSEAEVLELASAVEDDWDADGVRLTPGALATLSTRNAGRERLVYGRPRRFKRSDIRRKSAGRVGVTCEFDTVDGRFYSRDILGVLVPFVPPPSGLIAAPVSEPVTTTAQAVTQGAIYVAGTKPAYPVITVQGPITNPTVEVVGEWSLQLAMTITAGQSVTLDTRPWQQTVTRSDGASFPGRLTRASRMERATLQPGPHVIALSGIDNTGLSRLTFAWQNAYATI